MACSSNCTAGPHETYGECLRSKGIRTAYMQDWKGSDATAQKKADKNLDRYQAARKEGIQPKSTRPADVERAVRFSDMTGQAFQA